ncbi:MAG: hypothetical protein LBC98_10820, partial [Prevotellaceae bacterium]|nr:hypothetical protein [Prevotellaceae bacterium]MDR2564409.1 hypothetical protein [Prevotellaceae bacterium]
MSILDILRKIDAEAEEHEVLEFAKRYDLPISEFFKEKWDMFKQERNFEIQLKGKQIQLPNGKKGKEYSAKFDISSIGLPKLA